MRIYLDVSCLNRPFDDQTQARIQLEASAVSLILQRIDAPLWSQVSSQMATIEIDAMEDPDRRARVRLLLPESRDTHKLVETTFDRASELQSLGFKPADALHVAAAEEAGADILLSCDDRLCCLARRKRTKLNVPVANPLDWLKEIGDAINP
ncbi:MAG: PIN domain-containing protein [Planctomycetes bacterium]|nr:PIN domain-containing protein [Planctomycetota bacterium]